MKLKSARAKNERCIIIIDSVGRLLGLAVDPVEEMVMFQDENKTVFQNFPDGTLISGTIQHEKKLHVLVNLTDHSEKHTATS